MRVRKCGRVILGAELTREESAALDKEIRSAFAQWDDDHAIELDAMYLYNLRKEFGFGEDRLKRIFRAMYGSVRELKERYELETADLPWLYTKKLKDEGFDVAAWAAEMERESVKQ